MILVRGCKRARQVKTYLKKNAIKSSSPNSSIPPSLMLKEKWRRWQVSIAYVGFLTIDNAQLPTRFRTPGPQGSRTYNRYIVKESFFATAAGHTVDAWSWVKFKDSSWSKNPRVMKYRAQYFNFQRLSFVAKCWYFRQKLRLWRAGSQSFGFFPHRILQPSWHWAEFWVFSLFPQPSFTKTLIYLTLLNNSAWTEKANKGDRSTGRCGAVPSSL